MLTFEQAQRAGTVAAQITALERALNEVARAGDTKAEAMYFEAYVRTEAGQQPLHADIPMTVDETAQVFTVVVAVYRAKLDALNNELAKLGA